MRVLKKFIMSILLTILTIFNPIKIASAGFLGQYFNTLETHGTNTENEASRTDTNSIHSSYKLLSDSDGDGDPDSTDCDDSNATVYAGAEEVCDDVVNNCNKIELYYANGLYGWEHRIPIIVENTSSQTLEPYVFSIEVDYIQGMATDFSDLKFTDADGRTVFPHWIELVQDEIRAVVWIRVGSIPAKTSKTVYLYYENSLAEYQSNPISLFSFIDTFDSSQLAFGWNEISQNGGTNGVLENGYWKKSCEGECNWSSTNSIDSGIYKAFPTNNGADITWEAVTRMTDTTGDGARDFGMMLYKNPNFGVYWGYHAGYNRYEAILTGSSSAICRTDELKETAVPVFLKIKKTTANGVSSNNLFEFRYSSDGYNWKLCGSAWLTMSATGIVLRDNTSGLTSATFDYFFINTLSTAQVNITWGAIETIIDGDATDRYTWHVDSDGDGYGSNSDAGTKSCTQINYSVPNSADCDDENVYIHPGVEEICDGLDQNCDGNKDDVIIYPDNDGDGYGDYSSPSIGSCSIPTGYTKDGSDCNDNDSSISVYSTWYIDYDNDGYGSSEFTTDSCGRPDFGYVSNNEDCDDYDYYTHPNAIEICDGVANDCSVGSVYINGPVGWNKRTPILVKNENTTPLSNYAIRVLVKYDSDMQSDFDDIRFADSDGITILNHWMEIKTDSSSAVFWVKIPSLTANYTKAIYMYYNNTSAQAHTTSAKDVFIFADEFKSPLQTGWSEITSGGGAKGSFSSGKWTKTCNGECDWWNFTALDAGLYTPFPLVNGQDSTWEAVTLLSSTSTFAGSDIGMMLYQTTKSGIIWGYLPSYNLYESIIIGGSTVCKITNNVSLPIYFKIKKTTSNGVGLSNTMEFWYSKTGDSWTKCGTTNTSYSYVGIMVKDWVTGTSSGTFDYFYIRPSASKEPSITFDIEAVKEDSVALDAPVWYDDVDNDGYGDTTTAYYGCNPPENYVSNDGDCNDNSSETKPGTVDVCDGTDLDCDGLDGIENYYRDLDLDGYGDPNNVSTADCSPPEGYVHDGTDCNDLNKDVHEIQYWYLDYDQDDFGVEDKIEESCDQPIGYINNLGDCDDFDMDSYPGAQEICDEVMNDCDKRLYSYSGGLDGWSERTSVMIKNDNTYSLSDYAVRFTVPYQDGMQDDFNDIRFVDEFGSNLSFWIEKKTNLESAVFWVKVPLIYANGITVMYMYYGNFLAEPAGSIANLFYFSDDFSGPTLVKGWKEVTSGNASVGVTSNGTWTKTCNGQCDWWHSSTMAAGAMINFPNKVGMDLTWEAITRVVSGTPSGNRQYGIMLYSSVTNGDMWGYYPNENKYFAVKPTDPVVICSSNVPENTPALPVYFKIRKTTAYGVSYANYFEFYISEDGENWNFCGIDYTIMTDVGLFIKDWVSGETTATFDHFIVKFYATKEPSAIIGDVQYGIDANAVDASVWYQDKDGDSLGNPLSAVVFCKEPVGYVSNNLDTNDSVKN